MKEKSETGAEPSSAGGGEGPFKKSRRWRGFLLAAVALVLCFSLPLYDLARFAGESQLYSHIFLIPVISLYLIWVQRQNLPAPSGSVRKLAAPFLIAGLGVLALYWFTLRSFSQLKDEDYLALTTFSFLLFFAGICCVFLGKTTLRMAAFPLSFLVFMIPFPTFILNGIEIFLQHTSAAAASVLFKLSGTPVLQDDLVFTLPDITLVVAPECSGIHSSLVLFITSLLAGHLFLRSPWKRAVLTLVVIPLAIVRNGLRIFTIGELCVHMGPDMIDSYIHRRGGPIFFVLSLVPFFLLLYFLRRSDRGGKKGRVPNPKI